MGAIAAADFLVLGAGIIGTSVATQLKQRFPDARVVVIDKESNSWSHASGRNSGVVHAGFYYSADSLKARFTRNGNIWLTDYCEARGIPLNRCGKLVVAQEEEDLPQLEELYRRGQMAGVPMDRLSEAEAREIEPRVKTCGSALFSPTTASLDPQQLMRSLAEDARGAGVCFEYNTAYQRRCGNRIQTSAGPIEAGYVINAAGLYADRVAMDFGFSQRHRILPFKGIYLYSDEPAGAFRTNIYPVPNLRNPFLGVHVTVGVDGRAKIGPTAMPVFWREQYGGLRNFRARESVEIAARSASLLLSSNFEFPRLAAEEVRKYSRPRLVRQAARLATGVELAHYRRWGRPGVRAQLVDIVNRRLEMDFVIEGDDRSLHVLNAVSPGLTCSQPFAAHIVEQIGTLAAH